MKQRRPQQTPSQEAPGPSAQPARDPSGGRGNADRAAALPGLLAAATRGPGRPLPDRARMERAFGEDFGGVRLFGGAPEAEAALAAMGAEAAAFGSSILCSGEPSPEVLAHELAHVVQQGGESAGAPRGYGGGGAESRAEAAARAVSRGLPVPDVGSAPGDLVHRLVRTSGGAFDTAHYRAASADPANANFAGADILLTFTPNSAAEGSTVGLVQSVRSERAEGQQAPLQPTFGVGATEAERERRRRLTVSDPRSPGYGTRIDQPASNNPLYGVDGDVAGASPRLTEGARDPLMRYDRRPEGEEVTHPTRSTPFGEVSGHGQNGHRRGRDVQPATLLDTPRTQHHPGLRLRGTFETAAVGLDGPAAGRYLGSVGWGYTVDAQGHADLDPASLHLVSAGDPSPAFQAAASQWNDATLPNGQQTIDLPAAGQAPPQRPRRGT